MATLQPMPSINLLRATIRARAVGWNAATGSLPKRSGEAIGRYCDEVVATCIAEMLGRILVVAPTNKVVLVPPMDDCVELGPSRLVGAIRPQNFDIIYRPDGVRIVYDNKTLNNRRSVGKNWQNMINDLSSEASTVHIRFPYAVVAFIVMVPEPSLVSPHRENLISALERMSGRDAPVANQHLAEALAFVVYNPATGATSRTLPAPSSSLRINNFAAQIQQAYRRVFESMTSKAG